MSDLKSLVNLVYGSEATNQELAFAESIIRMCADIALREQHDPYECILKHFGLDK
jgi:hypothetical protein